MHYCQKIIAKLEKEKIKAFVVPEINFYMWIKLEERKIFQFIDMSKATVGSFYDEFEWLQNMTKEPDEFCPHFVHFGWVSSLLQAKLWERQILCVKRGQYLKVLTGYFCQLLTSKPLTTMKTKFSKLFSFPKHTFVFVTFLICRLRFSIELVV